MLLGIQMQRDVIFIVEIFQLGINLLKINKDLGLVWDMHIWIDFFYYLSKSSVLDLQILQVFYVVSVNIHQKILRDVITLMEKLA